ncbi:SLC13 family permease [Noviherbaspirillum pedocola]|uniref:Anion transporter n=1 Tax=Noviherbaspirillum pedocola TaxID=2801341 RepID=A0A934SRH1_9BURK|nr:SLC13 family permease [Noviherbaspirillum pedocola]MBK4734150.1 anion transporter [Noviherbaspirillum pedocola]
MAEANAAPQAGLLHGLFLALRRDRLFQILLLGLVLLAFVTPSAIVHYPRMVDWPTIATLGGLLTLTKGVETSGYLPRVARKLVGMMPNERALALFLVATTGLLSTVLTNDVALFVMVPLTLTLARAGVPLGRLVIFEAMAANAGSTATPIGNPQNLFLWQLSGTPFSEFLLAMLPLAAALMLALACLTLLAFSSKPLKFDADGTAHDTDRRLLTVALLLYPPFLILTDLHHPLAALLLVALPFLILWRRVLAQVDWALILIFILMFIDLRQVANLPALREWIAHWHPEHTPQLFLLGVGASQLISNVPAAILLAEYSKDWKTIAFAVDAGGFGLIIGSLANIIALRMAPERGIWLRFHAWSLPFLAAAAGIAWWLR